MGKSSAFVTPLKRALVAAGGWKINLKGKLGVVSAPFSSYRAKSDNPNIEGHALALAKVALNKARAVGALYGRSGTWLVKS